MAAWTSQQTGDWSAASNLEASPWYDGSTQSGWATIPQAGDTITIASGHTVTYDTDNSGGAGFSTLTINGTLTVKTTGGPYVLKMNGSSNITGSGGTFSAGSSETALPQAVKFTVDLGAASKFVGNSGSGLTVLFYCSQPPHPYVKLSAEEITGATSTDLTIDTDLTGEAAYWIDGSPIDICDVDKGLDYQGTADDQQILSTVKDADEITIAKHPTNNAGGNSYLDSTNIAGAYIFLIKRNIDVTFGAAGGANPNTYVFDTFTNSVFGCSIRGLGTTQNGRGVSYGSGCTISGAVSGCNYGIYYGTGHTVSGTVSGCTYGIQYGTGHTVSGIVSGCNYGIQFGSGYTVSGTVSGCGTGIYYGTGHTISGIVSGCNYGIIYGTGHTVSGTISGCNYGIGYGTGHTVSGTISGCGYGIRSSSIKLLRGATFSSNTYDVSNVQGEGYSIVEGHGAKLGSATEINLWKRSSVEMREYWQGVFLYDLADAGGTPQNGYVKCWMPGGRIATEASPPEGTGKPTAPVHHVYAEDDTAPVFLDIPIFGHKDIPLMFRCSYYDDDGGWSTLPQFQIIDPTYPFNHASAKLATETVANTQDEWQTIDLSYTPTADRMLILRFIGVGNSTSTIIDAWIKMASIPLTIPGEEYVLVGTDYGFDDQNSGEYVEVDGGDVEAGVTFGPSSGRTGTFVVPAEADVKDGVTFGDSEEFEGTYVGGGAGSGGAQILGGMVLR